MPPTQANITKFLESVHPYDSLPASEFKRVVEHFACQSFLEGNSIYRRGELLQGLYLVMEGSVEVTDQSGTVISQLSPRNSFGERGLMGDGYAVTSARAVVDTIVLVLPPDEFTRLMAQPGVFRRFFARGHHAEPRRVDMATQKVGDLMSSPPLACAPQDSVRDAARLMRDRKVSSLGVVEDGRLVGLLTTRDLSTRVLAEGLSAVETLVSAVMTHNPTGLPVGALGADVLNIMLEHRIGHLPVVDGDTFIGIITQTDLTRFQAISSTQMIREIVEADDIQGLRAATARIPKLLVQFVGGNIAHEVVTRFITDIADAVTRRLVLLAEETFGPPPVPFVWLACGSQGRQEQTGVSDQDNCIFIDDGFVESQRPWFENLARFVSDGLNACGYVYCPGNMMATNPRWCQPVHVWRSYFHGWIATPDPMAQMLASVMFDLRPIAGSHMLFADLQAETLERASRNSIFVAHMISNSLKHAPPLGLLRGFATVRSGEHRDHIDMKHNGVIPVVDLGRVYALIARLTPANTRARLVAAEEAGVISGAGATDLVAAYDLIAELRLRNQAAQIRAGRTPDNYLAPYEFGDFERSHLRDAFVVVRTMQSALSHRGSATV
ncbi:Hypoxic response protein 1 [Ensifer sp. M14]|uniref:DUF294 nucleotidyltransferase-like domain-containing protein n=1 Tax=Ensifer sp. M14 TaxID=2203782 RepID=UPI000E1DEB1B|nr:DUF294 nucleotidyltransferase-like domain-containing protein [Ensifer sp. M14]RDL47288.1 Hypoxic response protein 1 [Ensifer sp. M14]